MKKNRIMKSLLVGVCVASLMAGTAFASDATVDENGFVSRDLDTTTYNSPDVNNSFDENGDDMLLDDMQLAEEVQNDTFSGVISEIVKEDDHYRITTGDHMDGMIYIADETKFVFDANSKTFTSIADLEEGMSITAIVPKNTPMTMSIPAQISGAIGFVVNAGDSLATINLLDEELVNTDNTLKLNISEDTVILDTASSRRLYTAEDLKGKEVIVIYGAATMSIPAQTTPEAVIILPVAELATEDTGIMEDMTDSVQVADLIIDENGYVGIRDAAEAKGYEVLWTSNDEPIVFTKDDIRIEITIGSDEFTFTHNTRDIKPLDMMEKMDNPVKLENGVTMVTQSFVSAM